MKITFVHKAFKNTTAKLDNEEFAKQIKSISINKFILYAFNQLIYN